MNSGPTARGIGGSASRDDANAGRCRLMRAGRKGVAIPHDRIVEKLETARTIGLVTDYLVSPIESPRHLDASVTARRSGNANEDDVRLYLTHLLEGVVPAGNIVVTPPLAIGATEVEGKPQAEVRRSMNKIKLLRSVLFLRAVHLHGVATAAAMLTCLAIVLNVCQPNTRSSKPDGGMTGGDPGRTIAQQSIGDNQLVAHRSAESEALPHPDVDTRAFAAHGRLAVDRDEISTPVTLLMRASFIPVDVVPADFPANVAGDVGRKALREASGSADPVVQPQQNLGHSESAKNDMIAGVWAPDAGSCSARDFREGVLPTVITSEGAWAGETFCLFAKKEHTETGWKAVGKCSSPRERSTSNIRLTVSDNRLAWASKRGTQVYTRCAPDVLMAQAR